MAQGGGMSLLWVMAGQDPSHLDIQRVLDKARDAHEDAHQDDATTVTNFDPLHKSDIHPREHDGWMFMENSDPKSDFYKLGPEQGLTTYKHGITRHPLHLDPQGRAWQRQWNSDLKANSWHHAGSATDYLMKPLHHSVRPNGDTSHYDKLHAMGEHPDTPYNDDYKQKRNKALGDAGYGVIS